MILALVGFTSGCNKSNSGTAGGPGVGHGSGPAASARGHNNAGGAKANATFNLKPSNLSVTQGEKAQLTIGIDRHQFGGSVKLTFPTKIKDVTITGPMEIGMDQNEATLEVAAGPNAEVGEHQMMVQGEGSTGGPPAEAPFTITVKAASSAKSPPAGAAFDVTGKDITIAAGDAAEYEVGIHRAEASKEAVKVGFASLPEGVTVTPKTVTVEPGKTNATFKIAVAANAAPSTSQREIVATPTEGNAVKKQITFKINPPRK